MKKLIAILLVIALSIGIVGCGSKETKSKESISAEDTKFLLPHNSNLRLDSTKESIVKEDGLVYKDLYKWYQKDNYFEDTVDIHGDPYQLLYVFNDDDTIYRINYTFPTDDYATKLEELKEYFDGIYGEGQKIENDTSPDSTGYTWRVSLTDKQIFDIEAYYNKKDIQETGIKQLDIAIYSRQIP